jgi:hypothetical protein
MTTFETYRQGFLKDLEVRNYSPASILKYGHCVGYSWDTYTKRALVIFGRWGSRN